MLKVENLKANDKLKELSDEQLSTIASLSEVDETISFKEKINTEIGKMHQKYEDDIFSITGKKKNEGEKSFEYMKREFKSLKENQSSEETKTKLSELEKINKELKEKVKSGNVSDSFKTEMEKQASTIELLNNTLEQERSKYSNGLKAKDQEIFDNKFSIEQNRVMSEISLINSIPEAARTGLKESALSKVKESYKSSYMSLGGKDVLTFTDKENNTLLTNADGTPKTLSDLMNDNLVGMIESKTEKTSGANNSKTKSTTNVNFLNATTKQEADELITNQLKADGLDISKAEFHIKKREIKTENKDFLQNLQ